MTVLKQYFFSHLLVLAKHMAKADLLMLSSCLSHPNVLNLKCTKLPDRALVEICITMQKYRDVVT